MDLVQAAQPIPVGLKGTLGYRGVTIAPSRSRTPRKYGNDVEEQRDGVHTVETVAQHATLDEGTAPNLQAGG